MPPPLYADGKASAGRLLGVCLVQLRHYLLKSGAVKAVGEDGGVADNVLACNQFLHFSGVHLGHYGYRPRNVQENIPLPHSSEHTLLAFHREIAFDAPILS